MKANVFSSSVHLLRRGTSALLGGFFLVAIPLLSARAPAAAGPDHGDIAGVYALVSVNGANVPATLEHEGAKLVIRSGAFTINADGTCLSKMVFLPPSGPEVTRVVKAIYTREGTRLTMQWEGAGVTEGTVESDAFTMNNEGMVLSYRKS